jgi:hypothetical protein
MFDFLNPFKKSLLQLAISRAAKPGEDLATEVMKLTDYKISLRRDAEAICSLLEKIPYAIKDEKKYKSDLYALTGLFEQVEDFESDGFEVLAQVGIPELVRIAKASLARNDCDDDTLLYVLKILNLYGSEEGAHLLVAAARKPVKPDDWWWSPIFSSIGDEHPHREFIFRELSNPLPEKFIAIAMLDITNGLAMENALVDHPFNSASGVAQLRKWLTADDPDQFSYAVSATASLPYIAPTWRGELAKLAQNHSSALVRIEAAWSQAKSGDIAGIDELARLCLDVNLSQRAQHYLSELGRSDSVPAAASEPDFQAKADFANWLAHPNELGRAPDEVEIVDYRTLAWPPEREPKPFWLLRYRLRDESGMGHDDMNAGVIGSMTFCFFTYEFHRLPPEDCYAIHCYWEMQGQDLIEEFEVTDSAEYESMLSQWKGLDVQSSNIVTVAELSPELQYPQQLVALASGQQDGQPGWLVLDGPRSTWYPQADFPDSAKFTMLKLHVGRQLLGFSEVPDRKKFLNNARPESDPKQVIDAYQRLLAETETANEPRRRKLLADWQSPLFKHFKRYVQAKSALENVAEPAVLIAAYETILRAVRRSGEEFAKLAADELNSPLREQFEPYVDALVAADRPSDVQDLIDFYRGVWDHNLGYGLLGSAAFRISNFGLAENYFKKLHSGLQDYCRSEEMSLLAEIWCQNGRSADAQNLLVECLKQLLVLVKNSNEPSDREIYEKEFQFHRATFLRLFPALGTTELSRHGIHASTAS